MLHAIKLDLQWPVSRNISHPCLHCIIVGEPDCREEFDGLKESHACRDSRLTDDRVTICLTATPKAVDRATSSNR